MNQQRSQLNLTPEELAIAANQQVEMKKMLAAETNSNTASRLYTMLLEKWLERHSEAISNSGERIYPKPTANDLRWLAKIAAHYAPFVVEALGFFKIQDPKLESLDGIHVLDLLDFSGLMTVNKPVDLTQ